MNAARGDTLTYVQAHRHGRINQVFTVYASFSFKITVSIKIAFYFVLRGIVFRVEAVSAFAFCGDVGAAGGVFLTGD